jgi:hypothetical protein
LGIMIASSLRLCTYAMRSTKGMSRRNPGAERQRIRRVVSADNDTVVVMVVVVVVVLGWWWWWWRWW